MKRRSGTLRLTFLSFLIVLALGVSLGYKVRDLLPPGETFPAASAVSVRFSPRGGCTAAIVKEVAQAREEILLQAYSFTSREIASAVARRRREGVKVEAILDSGNRTGKYSAATFLAHAGVPVLIDAAHAIAHNKVIVIDGRTVITGSFNFTRAAEERNAENLLILHNAGLARKYIDNYLEHKAHSSSFKEQPVKRRTETID